MSSTAEIAARKEGYPTDHLPQSLSVIDCEKRKGVTRYYAYVIEIIRKNRNKYYIYRRYREFFKMVQRLEERFPIEAGSIRASDRIIPALPGKKYVGRSAIREVAAYRLPLLDDFLKKLYLMPDNIRYDSIILQFLRPSPEDTNKPYKENLAYPTGRSSNGRLSPKPPRPTVGPTTSLPISRPPPPSIAAPKKPFPPSIPPPTMNKPLPPKKPVGIQVSSKVSQFQPTKQLTPPPRPSKSPSPARIRTPYAKALYSYQARYNDELSVKAGSKVMLLRKVVGDWYEGKVDDSIGLVPGNYLEIVEPLSDNEESDTEDEWDDDETGKIKCHYKGTIINVDVDVELVKRPVFNKILFAIRAQLRDPNIVLNYKDSTGDLIEIVDNTDLQLMIETSSRGHKSQASQSNAWAIYVTARGDLSVYNTHPYH